MYRLPGNPQTFSDFGQGPPLGPQLRHLAASFEVWFASADHGSFFFCFPLLVLADHQSACMFLWRVLASVSLGHAGEKERRAAFLYLEML
jgi:hypothetical protein